MTTWWFSCNQFTVLVVTDSAHSIMDGAPIVRKFIGQHVKNLADFMRKIGGFEWDKI